MPCDFSFQYTFKSITLFFSENMLEGLNIKMIAVFCIRMTSCQTSVQSDRCVPETVQLRSFLCFSEYHSKTWRAAGFRRMHRLDDHHHLSKSDQNWCFVFSQSSVDVSSVLCKKWKKEKRKKNERMNKNKLTHVLISASSSLSEKPPSVTLLVLYNGRSCSSTYDHQQE